MLAATDTGRRHLRPAHWSRFVDAAFSLLFLIFWLVFEIAGLALLVLLSASAVSAAAGQPQFLGAWRPPADGSLSMFLVFALFWMTLWTAGGVAAGTNLLRQIAGEDAVDASADGVQYTRRAGPFQRHRTLPRASIHRLRTRLNDKAVVADTDTGTHVIADLGTATEREALRAWIVERLALRHAGDREIAPLERDIDARGQHIVVTHPSGRTRAQQQWVVFTVAALMALGCIGIFHRGGFAAASGAEWISMSATAIVAAFGIFLRFARGEWILGAGQLRVRWRCGPWIIRDRTFEAPARLELEHLVDSDGDDRFNLIVRDDTRRYALAHALYDQFELLGLGEWLSARTGLAFARST